MGIKNGDPVTPASGRPTDEGLISLYSILIEQHIAAGRREAMLFQPVILSDQKHRVSPVVGSLAAAEALRSSNFKIKLTTF